MGSVETPQNGLNGGAHAGNGGAGGGPFSAEVAWIKSKLKLICPLADDGDADAWLGSVWQEDTHAAEAVNFFTNLKEPFLFAYLDAQMGDALCVSRSPSTSCTKLLYFVRDPAKFVTPDNLGEIVQFGLIQQSNLVQSIYNVMSNLYLPSMLKETSWPDTVRKQFTGQLHKFMATLTEVTYSKKGKTMLYIPQEGVNSGKDKDLIQRMESILIHWTRQVKEVVNNQDNSELGEDAGPLAEIEFWRSRSVDLGGIREQLENQKVKDIIQILEVSKSSYLAPFLNLSNSIQKQTMAAEDNLKFLLSLEKPCQLLAKASPNEIPELLPKLLHCIRMIWNISRFYNTPERLTGLLRKVSNEIIQRCCAKIALNEIFEGDVEKCMILLQESIKAGEEWKQAYLATAKAISQNAQSKAWDFDVSSIFAHTDAFVQRCRDMLEVCEAQLQFAPKTELPTFGGTHGPEITKSLQDIQVSFQKLVSSLKSLNYNILDVKATSWHDDYNIFKSGVKDLEVMLTNVIVMAFESVSTLVGRIELLLAFKSMAKRESIKRSVEKKTAECFSAFVQELNIVKKHFDQTRKSPPSSPHLPKYSGAAMWALSLCQRLIKPMNLLNKVKGYLPQVPESAELHQAYTLTTTSMEQYVKSQHLEWFNSIDTSISQKLETNLISSIPNEEGLLKVNFDKDLLSLFHEVQYWERLRLDIPYIAMEIQSQRERFRILQEQVLLVAKDYNAILTSLDAQERLLFADRIHYLDRRISPGIHKLTWVSSPNQLDYFIKEARKFCNEGMSTVEYFKSSHRRIEMYCKVTSEMILISIEKKRVYEHEEFKERQISHKKWINDSFEKAFKDISDTMSTTFEIFANDSDNVKDKWEKYTQQVDKRMEDSLRFTVKKSLQELSRALNGDAKTEVVPMYATSLVLARNDLVELQPSLQDLYNMVLNISNDLISTTKSMPRLYLEKEKEESTQVSFFELISNDEDVTLKTVSMIASGVTSLAGQVQQFLKQWEKKYAHIWTVNKEDFILSYKKANKPLVDFENEINKYKELQERVMSEDSTSNMAFLRIDCTPLKQALVHHCGTWINKLLELLNELARSELQSLHDYFKSNTEALKKPVMSLDMLADSVNLLRRLKDEKAQVYSTFAPILEKYTALESFEVTLTPEEITMRDLLPVAWTQFEKDLEDTAIELDNAKENFRDKLSKMVDNFAKEVTESRQIFLDNAPFQYEATDGDAIVNAFKYIEETKQSIAESRKTVAELKSGLDIFGMQHPQFRELTDNDKDLDLLTSIWTIIKEWSDMYNSWKDGLFRDLNVEEMEEQAIRINKRIIKIGREIKSWSVWKAIKEIVDAFKRTMPLIVDLRNPAMRERHWAQLMDTVGEQFDPHGSDFTLASVIRMQLEQHADAIREMSGNASKELAIEVSIQQIEETWKELDLDMVEYKDGIYKLRSTEDLFTALEDNTVSLSTMKASKFFMVFENLITSWEKSLSLVSETIEIMLQVQRNWMYLENIFIGSESIHKELPQESAMFESVHYNFIAKMKEMHDIKNVLDAALTPGMLDNFTDMDTKLEKIQKSLDNYLESKRQQFPRFYFLSSDDLLEILGQAKDPLNVQPHLKKCFEGVAKLDMKTPDSTHRFYEAHGINAKDTEYLPFISPIVTQGRPEDWLNDIEAGMYATTKKNLLKTLEESKGMKKEKWVKEYHGQFLITAGQILWTAECEKALGDHDGLGGGGKAALKLLKKKWVSYLNKLTFITRSRLNKVERNKVVALITIEVHSRDVIEKLAKLGCNNSSDFNWVSQLRFYWDRDQNDCVVKQVLSVFSYGYEYQGNNGRLVITPLTDRCYMTLGAAMFTRRGGNPLGPAGTGKTETVKDFGKALARYVIVFNCSDGVDYKMTGKMFSGLAQTGAWACLDEFNRIEVEVLSVVATQIGCVMEAIKQRKTRFNFLGSEIRLIPTCGIFVTMNPGYAGRSELPDNLKAIVRPVSMMVPDFALIAEIMMFSEGFNSAKNLAKKMIAIMELSQQQLSKQDHYDYGLRSFVIPIARAAGQLKRADPDVPEEVIMYRTMVDLIKPKLVYLDLPLFMALLSDLFPGVELPANDGGALREAIVNELKEHNLQIVPEFITKIIQIYDCKVARHGNMIVGKTGAGKSVAWKCLQRALGRLVKQFPEVETYAKVNVHTINPLALSNDEMYGCFDANTHEWQDGILARIMRNVCKDESRDQKWILFDGPVDTLWIESMNTLLDDNKLLTLLSGERISMVQQVSILFEVEDLSQASPATVSRAGMIYLNVEDLGWRPFIKSWLREKKKDSDLAKFVEPLSKLTERYLDPVLDFKRRNCKELVPVDALSSVRSLTVLFDSLSSTQESMMNDGNFAQVTEMWFLFSLVWAIGGTLETEDRKKFDSKLREMDTLFPPSETVFEYTIDTKKCAWVSWEEKLPAQHRPSADTPFSKIMVPTVDTVRTKMVSKRYVGMNRHVLLVGNVGVGKTMLAQSILENITEQQSSMTVNFSAQTSSNSLQDTIEGRLEKRTKGVFAPAGGKHLITFIDDLNMPQKSKFGFIPPLELLKLWVDNGFWYDRLKCEVKHVKDMQLMASMAPPGGGRNHFSQRILACFSVLNMTAPNEVQLKRIFSTFLHAKLADFDDEIKPMADTLTQASIHTYASVCKDLLPTPSKCHYLFNTRDLSRVIQGVMQATKQYYDNPDSMLQLWVHETLRIYGDRMWDPQDKQWLKERVDESLSSVFTTSWNAIFEEESCPPFVNFMKALDNPPYEAVTDDKALKDFLMEKLEDYALEPGKSAMNLVLFKDALHHVCKIHRILQQPRGNALLVGVGGSGRKSLAKLASYVAELKCFQIEITKNYRIFEFREDLKNLYRLAGCTDKPTVFLFDETQIVSEVFLEDINNILTSGEVPNLYPKEELTTVLDAVRLDAKKAGAGETADQLYTFLIERVRKNLHVVLCLSPVGESFRERVRMFPGLVNCTTIDWFTEWPEDALYEVATKQLEEENLGTDEIKEAICKVFVTVHSSTSVTSSQMLQQLKRHNYVTPTNYLEFVNGYSKLLREKRAEIGDKANKLKGGLQKLDETAVQVTDMQVLCQEKKVVVAQAKRDCEELLVEIVQDKRTADEQEKQVNAEAQKIAGEAEEANKIASECQAGLDKALPALQAAEEALNVLTKKDMAELKVYQKPPKLVETTCGAVLTLLKRPANWDEAKKQLGDSNFLAKLMTFDKDKLDDTILKKVSKYTTKSDFTPEAVGKVSYAAKGLCLWVYAMEVYGHVAKEIAPKRAKLKNAQEQLSKKQAQLAKAQEALAEVLAKVQALRDKYEASTASKEALQKESDELEIKLERAEKLVNGLAGEKNRWESSIDEYDKQYEAIPGDVVVASAFLSYAGPFPSEYRESLVQKTWLTQVQSLNIPSSPNFDFALFLANPSDVRDWNIQGLPSDTFSTENGVLVSRGNRWPLMIDPQGQAKKWIKNMEGTRGCKILSQNSDNMMRNMENAIQFGNPVLLQDILEVIDPALEPILAKSFIKKGNSIIIKLGEKEIDYNPDFKLYITTKLSNPHYTPEISTKTTIVNFAVKEQGLEAQLLSIVVQKERPDLDKQKNDLIVKVAQGKRTQSELEDKILYMLSTAEGSLLDNVDLINTLDDSKTTWEEVSESLKIAEKTSEEIRVASQEYRPCSIRAAILYFVLYDLASIDPMYQFSLDAYTDLFVMSISKAAKSENVSERIKNLNDYHTYALYRYTSRGLFEKHKLLLSLQICVRILQNSNQINNEEWQFFLRGGQVLDRTEQAQNPAPTWISEEAWDNITESENLPGFKDMISSFQQNAMAWEEWYRNSELETSELPGEWESKCTELQKMILIRSLRPDRVIFAATTFVANSLGRKYVEPPVLELQEVYNESEKKNPLIFVLSPGVDPTDNLRKLADQNGLQGKFFSVALGQGQAPVATRLIEDGVEQGFWVFLANCHLMTSWLPKLDKIIEDFGTKNVHEHFRLWLSSSPSPHFPIAILQRGLKMTTEPPKGLRSNLLRLYNNITEESFHECKTSEKYCKLLFSLCYFHAVLLERRKFRTLGLNIPYDFNDTDFKVSDDLLKTYLDEYEETPWDALKYLIAEANYGGRVTDELDRRVLHAYLNQFYCEDILQVPNYQLSSLPNYYIPENGPLQTYKDYITTLPIVDHPEALGQHPNADISYMIEVSPRASHAHARTRTLLSPSSFLLPPSSSLCSLAATDVRHPSPPPHPTLPPPHPIRTRGCCLRAC